VTHDQTFLIALGANIPSTQGAPEQTLRRALACLDTDGITLGATSRFFATPCFPPGAGPDYVNAAARLCFAGTPGQLLDRLHAVEARFGRQRVQRWGRRTLDLDLIAAGDTVLPDPATHAAWRDLPADRQKDRAPDRLILPHPRLEERAFVLVPLSDVAPDWRHPVSGRTVREMLQSLGRKAVDEVRPL